MKAIINRVLNASLTIEEKLIGEIATGFTVYVGFKEGDTLNQTDWLVNKITGLRIMEDPQGKMNLALSDVGGQIMVIPNFTLYADCKHGFRPSFINAMEPAKAKPFFEAFCKKIQAAFNGKIVFGVFGADMKINQTNNGPINIIIEN